MAIFVDTVGFLLCGKYCFIFSAHFSKYQISMDINVSNSLKWSHTIPLPPNVCVGDFLSLFTMCDRFTAKLVT